MKESEYIYTYIVQHKRNLFKFKEVYKYVINFSIFKIN